MRTFLAPTVVLCVAGACTTPQVSNAVGHGQSP